MGTTFELNNCMVTSNRESNSRLLDVLRDEFSLMGTKCGCEYGECGACAVLIDGKLMNTCLIAVGSVADKKIITIEGYQMTKRYAVLKQAFKEHGVDQRAFYTPGLIMAIEALLIKKPYPTEDEIIKGLSGNISRNIAYGMVVKAVQKAAREGIGLW